MNHVIQTVRQEGGLLYIEIDTFDESAGLNNLPPRYPRTYRVNLDTQEIKVSRTSFLTANSPAYWQSLKNQDQEIFNKVLQKV